jgi:DDE superfamily endonuclease
MPILPDASLALLDSFAPVFTQPTYHRFLVLMGAALLTTGRRTVANLLRTAGSLAPGNASSYRRAFSGAHWSMIQLACALARLLVTLLPGDAPIVLAGDDTVVAHPGPHVYGKARHRDPVRSSHAYTAWRYGHKWVVLAMLVRFPFATRPWALPVLVALYQSEEADRDQRHRHRTPAQHMTRLLAVMLRWFPDRRFVFVGDSAYGAHELARFVDRHRKRLCLVSKLHPEANLFEPPPTYKGKGRPAVKGQRLPKPREAVSAARRFRRHTVAWYGGGTRRVQTRTGTGHWFKSGKGLVPIRWVFVRDREGTHRDEYFYTTDLGLSVERLIGYYAGRWNIETTFEEVRSGLHLETTCGWCRNTVLRVTPCLFGLYSVVALLYHQLPADRQVRSIEWPGKVGVAFSDALTAVRRWVWAEGVFAQVPGGSAVEKLPDGLREVLYSALAPAA